MVTFFPGKDDLNDVIRETKRYLDNLYFYQGEMATDIEAQALGSDILKYEEVVRHLNSIAKIIND